MSTQDAKAKNDKDKKAVRSKESLYAETIICKNMDWKIGFFSGGISAYSHKDIEIMLKVISEIAGEKIWINLGATPKDFLIKYSPYIKGVVGSVETVNKEIHKKVCPSKPLEPYKKMFETSKELGLKNAMTIILGLGETKEDLNDLIKFIKKYDIEKLHLYALNPIKETIFENKGSPSSEYHAWYLAKLRIAFPKLDIQMGIWKDKLERVVPLLKAGANSISKFPIIRYFGRKEALLIETQARKVRKEFSSNVSSIPDVNWNSQVDKIKSLDDKTKVKVKEKLHLYLDKMRKNLKK